ncbi:hypothetical protein ACFWN5_11825 [Streptomyces sp. NPDC058430]|uniref:hypothetical protein n=1 Tax=unclassified Streptomyces TaxID=2593676 RepID=UPI003641EA32
MRRQQRSGTEEIAARAAAGPAYVDAVPERAPLSGDFPVIPHCPPLDLMPLW